MEECFFGFFCFCVAFFSLCPLLWGSFPPQPPPQTLENKGFCFSFVPFLSGWFGSCCAGLTNKQNPQPPSS